MEILTIGTFPFRWTAREITDALWNCYGRRFWSRFPANDNHLRIRICMILYVANIQLITAFTNFAHVNEQGQPDPLISPDEFQSKVNSLALAFIYLFIGAFAATYVKNTCWYVAFHGLSDSAKDA